MTLQNKEGLEALLPCPFCGGPACAHPKPVNGYPRVMCEKCLGRNSGSTTEEAIAGWNRRAPDPLVSSLREENERLRKERDQLSDDLYEERQKPWPEWAEKVLKAIRKRSGYDGYDDADGVDLPEELEEAFAELEREADRHTHEVRASKEFKSAKDAADHYRGKVTELCAEITASQAQLKIYREALEEVSKGIGSVRWMDPPDGGNVSLGEQVRRMRIDLETAERWRDSLREALTPSGDTKAAYSGEFYERIEVANPMHEGNEDDEPETIAQTVIVSWVTIKEVMAAIRARAADLQS